MFRLMGKASSGSPLGDFPMAGSFQISSVRYIIVMCCFLLDLNYSSIYFHSIIAAEYANLELIPPYLHPGYNRYIDGANFASGGAGALDETRQGLECILPTMHTPKKS